MNNAAAQGIRRIVLRESKRANVGHIGSCLCVADILAVLYGEILRISSPNDPERDRFILSKGHAGLALFAALAIKGFIPESALETFCGDNTLLGVHPEATLPGVDFSTGSLGQGLSIAAGAALAARLQRSDRRIFCLISDAECNEGSTWEAVMFAAHHGLTNLTAIVDWNGQQAFGTTHDVLDSPNMPERWRAFGWHVTEVDGHDLQALFHALSDRDSNPMESTSPLQSRDCEGAVRSLLQQPAKPRVVLARTVFGKGVSFMEQGIPLTQTHLPVQPINWHYLPMSDTEYQIAVAEIEPVS